MLSRKYKKTKPFMLIESCKAPIPSGNSHVSSISRIISRLYQRKVGIPRAPGLRLGTKKMVEKRNGQKKRGRIM